MPGAISLGLARINRLLYLLKSPHCATPVVHISGTNGKGSVSAYLSSILSHSHLAVGRFNSPHLADEWDCVQLHGRTVDPSQFYAVKREVQRVSQREAVGATSFEVLTATAFSLFARAQPPLDVAVVEVGMGGAEDATNVVPADKTLVSVVTAVDLDHQKFLGDSVHDIAQVKAGIAREGGDVVLSAGEATLVEHDARASTSCLPPPPLVSIPLAPTAIHPPFSTSTSSPSPAPLSTRLPLPGAYQLSNAATAVLAAQLLRTLPRAVAMVPSLETHVTDDSMRAGVEATTWPGRLSWLSLPTPLSAASTGAVAEPAASSASTRPLLLDGAHNPSSARLLAAYLSSLPPSFRPTALVFALSAPRDPTDVVKPLLDALAASDEECGEARDGRAPSRRVRVVCTGFSPPAGMEWVRATPPDELARAVKAVVDGDDDEGAGSSSASVEVLEADDVEAALRLLEEGDVAAVEQGPVVVAGSLYLAADVLRLERRLGAAREGGREGDS
ncbi:uncharacterized protein RHOBADRAFT_18538 [Rhodotorula graminis WP1]|uniref:Mur ligase central domain-containing protein n=1 Tax=Rhodotorula graminis (strain WP1) TaxID=578459 RepID=A0A0P9EKA3_RHOGW|nr:uncharacterized protein RHOBADRAFT_18538 [Rhodotorula graminis WP1]KPV72098.1 hypothetical protein RHOBADRAFT_18538 [Rhodotorula graminis WP1]